MTDCLKSTRVWLPNDCKSFGQRNLLNEYSTRIWRYSVYWIKIYKYTFIYICLTSNIPRLTGFKCNPYTWANESGPTAWVSPWWIRSHSEGKLHVSLSFFGHTLAHFLSSGGIIKYVLAVRKGSGEQGSLRHTQAGWVSALPCQII